MKDLLTLLSARIADGARLIAIDGNCCAGKSTVARLLAAQSRCNVFHMDDFFLRPAQRTPERLQTPGENVDHERFLDEVLRPLRNGDPIRLSRYDCMSGSLLAPVDIAPQSVAIVEGTYALHPALRDAYDYKVFLTVSPAEQRKRLQQREGAGADRFFSLWLPLEQQYITSLSVTQRADLVVDTTEWKVEVSSL